MRLPRLFRLSASVGVFSACALLGGGKGDPDDEPNPAAPRVLTLFVENDNFYDATVSAVTSGGERRRLGIVGGNGKGHFTFRWAHDELRVLIQLLAGRSAVSQPIMVQFGDTLNLVITSDLHLRVPDGPQ